MARACCWAGWLIFSVLLWFPQIGGIEPHGPRHIAAGVAVVIFLVGGLILGEIAALRKSLRA
jgi:hypothetical protein